MRYPYPVYFILISYGATLTSKNVLVVKAFGRFFTVKIIIIGQLTKCSNDGVTVVSREIWPLRVTCWLKTISGLQMWEPKDIGSTTPFDSSEGLNVQMIRFSTASLTVETVCILKSLPSERRSPVVIRN